MALLDEAMGGGDSGGRFVVVEDCVETSGAFVLHHLIKRVLSSPDNDGVLILLALARPFSYYDRVLKKLRCNLSAHRDKNNLHFFDIAKMDLQVSKQVNNVNVGRSKFENGFLQLFDEILKAVEAGCTDQNRKRYTIMIDDLSLLEIATHGDTNLVMDFLHYCATINHVECSIVVLNHMDIYSITELPQLLSQLEYLADVIIKAEPLSTGLAADVHGQLTVINKGIGAGCRYAKSKVQNFHFKVKENGVDCFYPGIILEKVALLTDIGITSA